MYLGHTRAEWEGLFAAIARTLANSPRIAAVAKTIQPKPTRELTTEELWEMYESLPAGKAKADFFRDRILPRIAQAQTVKEAIPSRPAELWARHAEIRATHGAEAATRFFNEKIKPVTLVGWRNR